MKEDTQEVVFHFDELTEENINNAISVLSDLRNWHYVNDKGERIDQDHCTFCFNDLGDSKQKCLQSENVYNDDPEWLKDTEGVRASIRRIWEMTEEEHKKMFDKKCWETIQNFVKKYGEGATDNEVH